MKQWMIKSSFVSVVLLGLVACVSTANLAQTRHVRQVCEQRCDKRAAQCQGMCQDDCQTCTEQAKVQTQKYYKRYVHGRCVEGKTIILRLQSYHDPLQCLKKTCNCADDYRVCMAACSGSIHKRLQHEITCC